MESGQLIPEELMRATTLLANPPTEITAAISDKDGHPQNVQIVTDSEGCPQYLQVLTDSEGCLQSLHALADGQQVATETSEACRNVENSEPGLSLIQPTEDNLWVNNPIQYVVIQKVDNAGTTEGKPEITALLTSDGQANEESGSDKLQCGLCGKIVDNVKLFLHHKATHVARGMGLGCEICGLSFSRQLALTQHYKRKHKIFLVDGQSSKTGPKNYSRPPRRPPTASKVPGKFQESLQEEIGVEALQTTVDFDNMVHLNSSVQKEEVNVSQDASEILENEPHAEQICEAVNIVGDNSLHKCMNILNESKIDDSTEPVIGETMYVIGDKRPEHFTEEVQDQETIDGSEMLTSETVETVSDSMTVDVTNKVTVPTVVHVTETDLSEVDATNKIMVPTVVHAAETDLSQVDMIELGNSNSSEKENVVNTGEVHTYSLDNVKHKLGDSASEKMIKLSHSMKELAHELDMPDFHFIPVIERKNKRSRMQGGRYSFRCLYCGIKVSWRSTLCKHMREKHADILKVGPLLNIPDKVSGEHEVMKMSDYIKLETRPSGKRIRGVETQDLPGDFLCDKCDKVFNRLRYLRKHQVVHKSEKNLLCSVCVKSFRTLANLKQHMKSHKDREAYKCSECDFESAVNIAIHTHRQVHSKGCVLCEICGSAYTDKSTLTKHKQVHNPLRPFACQYPGCTWRFKTKVMCAAHFRSHTSKGKFVCSVCGYAFRQKHHLQRHEKKVHNIVQEQKPVYTYLEPTTLTYNREEDSTRLETSNTNNVQEVSLVINEGTEVSVDTVEDQFDLESALQTGQLVIATEDGSTINYEMSDIGMSMSYQTLLQDGDGNQLDAHAILVPQSDGSHIVYQHEEVAETVTTEDKA